MTSPTVTPVTGDPLAPPDNPKTLLSPALPPSDIWPQQHYRFWAPPLHPCHQGMPPSCHCHLDTVTPVSVPKALPLSLGTASLVPRYCLSSSLFPERCHPLSLSPRHCHPPLSLTLLITVTPGHCPSPPSLSPISVPCCFPNPILCSGYFGDSCVSACALDPCEPPGTCTRRPGMAPGYACHCPPGTFGALCQHRLVTLWGTCVCWRSTEHPGWGEWGERAL